MSRGRLSTHPRTELPTHLRHPEWQSCWSGFHPGNHDTPKSELLHDGWSLRGPDVPHEGSREEPETRYHEAPILTLAHMRFGSFRFGSIEVDGTTYDHDLVIDRGDVRKRKKGPSKSLRSRYGHTPLSLGEDIRGTVSAS